MYVLDVMWIWVLLLVKVAALLGMKQYESINAILCIALQYIDMFVGDLCVQLIRCYTIQLYIHKRTIEHLLAIVA